MAQVLILGAEPARRRAVSELLEPEHITRGVDSVKEAVALMTDPRWEVIVIDAQSFDPGDGGLSVESEVLKLRAHPAQPEVVLLAEGVDAEFLRTCLRAGAYDLLAGPVDSTALRSVVVNAAQVRCLCLEGKRVAALQHEERRTLADRVEAQGHVLEQIFANLPAVVFRLVQHKDTREFVYVSSNAESILGISDEQLRDGAQLFESVLHPEDRRRFLSLRADAEARGSVLRFDGRFFAPSSETRWLQFSAKPCAGGAGTNTWDGVIVDVTERMELSARWLAADQVGAIGSVSASLVHELSNPLFCLTSALTLISDSAAQFDAEVKETLLEADSAAERMVRVLNDLRPFAALDRDRSRSVRLTQALDASVRLASNEIRHRATLVRKYSGDPWVWALETKLAQLFLNVIISAARSIPEGDASGNVLTVAVQQEQRHVRVEISNTGRALRANAAQRALDPEQATSGRLRADARLYIAEQISVSLGGEITVSRGGEGVNTFCITLPLSEPARAVTSGGVSPIVRQKPVRSLRVLVVDDEVLVVRALARTLIGHDVRSCSSGAEALAAIASAPPFDLILCDVMMPDMTGVEVFDAVRHRNPGTEQRIVFVTGGAFTQAAAAFLTSVPNKHLRKPFNRAQVEALVAEIGDL